MTMRALVITAIVLVAVVMGLSAVASVMTYVDASQPIPAQACDALRDIPDPSPKLAEFIEDHCGLTCDPTVPPGCT